jgi:choline/glycine/proline betaine transport protein
MVDRTDHPAEQAAEPRSRINPVVFYGAAVAIIAFAVWAIVSPEGADNAIGLLMDWISRGFGWFYILLSTVVLVFVIVIAASRYGKTKLGPDHSEPDFSLFSWAAMLFAAGIGTDLMFFGVAGPVTQYLAPPVGEGETIAAAREATVWTIFHYGVTGWGMYALMGMALGYFAYRMNLRLAIRSALYPIFGDRIYGPLGDVVDLAAIVGTIFGIATTLGIGVVQINFGLEVLFGIPEGLPAQIGLIVFGVAIAIISAVSGIARGIRRLSELNVWLTIGLAAFVLITGPTIFLLNALVVDIGNYVSTFPSLTMETFAYEQPTEWLQWWTLFFWAWWIAWASFVGLFLARISRGRTIRQFVVGTLTIPFLYIVVWISIFGNTAVEMVMAGAQEFGEIAMNQPEQGFYTMLQEFPAFLLVGTLATFVGLLFYITSADSGALVMGNLSSYLKTPNDDTSAPVRIFWAMAIGLLTLAMLIVGGVPALQNATVIMGLPFAFVLILVMFGLYQALRVEGIREDSRVYSMPERLSGRVTGEAGRGRWTWQQRLRRSMNFPSAEEANQFLSDVALPALQEVQQELAEHDVDAAVTDDADELGTRYIELRADVDAQSPFQYRVSPRAVYAPRYAGRSMRAEDRYHRVEVHLREGGQGYDIMGFTKSQLIDDVLDQYEQHLEFIRLNEADTL